MTSISEKDLELLLELIEKVERAPALKIDVPGRNKVRHTKVDGSAEKIALKKIYKLYRRRRQVRKGIRDKHAHSNEGFLGSE